MPEQCAPDIIREHERRISCAEKEAERANTRMDNLEDFKEVMNEISTNVSVMAEQMKGMMQTLIRHEQAIDKIEDRMETKESVGRLHGKIEELEMMIETNKGREQEAKIEEYEDMRKYITKIIISAALFVAVSLIIFAVVVLAGLANAGALPTA